jgi:hypothetical protein
MASTILATPGLRLVTSGILFSLTLLSGLWLSGTGKPYQSLPFNLHKMIAVATVVILVIAAINWFNLLGNRPPIALALAVVAALLLLALVVSGSLLTLGVDLSGLSLKVHKIVPLLALAASAASLYLLVHALGQ